MKENTVSSKVVRGRIHSQTTGPLTKGSSLAQKSKNINHHIGNRHTLKTRRKQLQQPEHTAASCNRNKETEPQTSCKETDAPQAYVPHNRGPVSLGVVQRPAHCSRAPPTGHIQGHRSLLFNLSDGRSTKVSCHSNETATPRGLKTPPLSPRGHGLPSPPRSAAQPAGQGTSRPEEWKSPMQNSGGP